MTFGAGPAALVVLAQALLFQALPSEKEPLLEQGSVIEREIESGQTHRYRLELAQRDYLRAVVEQLGVNVAVVLRGPDGTAVVERDREPNRLRPERVHAVVEAAGPHVLEVRSLPGEPAGRYRVRIETLRPATATDRTQAAAETMYAHGPSAGEAEIAQARAQAKARLDSLRQDFHASGDGYGEAMALYQLGQVELESSDPHAFVPLQQALALFRAGENEYGQMVVMTSLGEAHEWQHDMPAALASYEEGLALGERVDDAEATSFYLSKAGMVLAATGQAERALGYFTRALPLYRKLSDGKTEARTLNNIGIAFRMLGDYRRALGYVEQALSLSRKAGVRDGESSVLINIASLYRSLGDHIRARNCYEQALALAREAQSAQEEAADLDGLASLYLLEGDHHQAIVTGVQALALWRRLSDPLGEAESLDIVGQGLGRSGESDAALEHLREAAQIRERFNRRNRLAETLLNMAIVERDRGHLPQALAHAERAVELVERLRSEVTNPDLRASFVAAQQDVYGVYIDILMLLHETEPSAGHDAAALQASERAHARVLLETLIEARADIREGVDASLLDRERAVQKRLSEASERLSAAVVRKGATADVARARGEFDGIAEELREVQSLIRRSSPRYAALTQPVPATVAEIRRGVLDDETVLLEFYLGEKRSFLWAVTATNLVNQPLPGRSAIEGAARRLYRLLTERQRGRTSAAVVEADQRLAADSSELSRLLLGGIARRLGSDWRGKRLLIVAAGALAYVPFGDLPSPDDATRSLLVEHEIVSAPSASVLIALRQEHAVPSSAATTVAILADPVFDASDPRVHGRAGIPKESVPSALTRAAESLGRDRFNRLPFSRQEADGIATLMPAASLLEATDFGASRALVTGGRLGDRRIVHFATHGILDSEHPDLSGLVLSLVDEKGAPVDGFLRMHQLYNLRLPTDLVVLSACQTALGREIRGEGLVGLTRGFLYAGARAVVASLWQVDDESTAELMKRFYRGMLKEGRRPAEALRAAQLEMSRDKRWSAPFYWAGFVLQGEWR